MEETYAIIGKPTAKVKGPDGIRRPVKKRIHILHDGLSLCQSENGYKNIRYTPVVDPIITDLCRNCVTIREQRL